MDPMAVVRVVWRHKFIALPFAVIAVGLFVGALLFGPRAYQASASYAMITPSLPGPLEVDANPALAEKINNPYLRSSDPTLVLEVGKTRLSSEQVADTLVDEGLSTEYTVGQGLNTSSQILVITAGAATPDVAVATAGRLGELLQQQILEAQIASGASPEYVVSIQPINVPTGAVERVSSRLRNAAVAGIGGLVLFVGALSLARAIDRRRNGDTERPASLQDAPRQQAAFHPNQVGYPIDVARTASEPPSATSPAVAVHSNDQMQPAIAASDPVGPKPRRHRVGTQQDTETETAAIAIPDSVRGKIETRKPRPSRPAESPADDARERRADTTITPADKRSETRRDRAVPLRDGPSREGLRPTAVVISRRAPVAEKTMVRQRTPGQSAPVPLRRQTVRPSSTDPRKGERPVPPDRVDSTDQ